MGLPKHRRLRAPKEFRHVLNSGRRARDGLVAVAAARNHQPDQPARFGFSVSRRVGGAVVRNRVKRRLRQIASSASIHHGWDVVLTAFPDAADSNSHKLANSVDKLARRIGLLSAQAPATRRRSRDLEQHDG